MPMTTSSTVSANTLFHFTSELDYLVGILESNFYPRYCLEDHSAFFPDSNQDDSERAIPMVCFCDIPLSNIRNHIEVYGEYAIGLKKEWGKKNKISPLMYFHNNSISVEMMRKNLEVTYEMVQSCNAHGGNTEEPIHKRNYIDQLFFSLSLDSAGIRNWLIYAMGFTKQYSGTFYRNGKQYKDVCFYNEREWRYIPDIFIFSQTSPFIMKKNVFLNEQEKLKRNSKIANEETSLKFTPKDIKYIIVSKETEIPAMIEKIKTIKKPKYELEDIELLQTRIISMEQILQDF